MHAEVHPSKNFSILSIDKLTMFVIVNRLSYSEISLRGLWNGVVERQILDEQYLIGAIIIINCASYTSFIHE